jgi:hypothetical protein
VRDGQPAAPTLRTLELELTTAAAVLLAILGLALYRLQEKREHQGQIEEPPPGEPEPSVSLLFVAGHPGYRLLEIEPRALTAGSLLDVEGETYVVARVGPAPLPEDSRRCAYVEPADADAP